MTQSHFRSRELIPVAVCSSRQEHVFSRKAIREALANVVMHSHYQEHSLFYLEVDEPTVSPGFPIARLRSQVEAAFA
jgi:predicted HTH transcriptional regulator